MIILLKLCIMNGWWRLMSAEFQANACTKLNNLVKSFSDFVSAGSPKYCSVSCAKSIKKNLKLIKNIDGPSISTPTCTRLQSFQSTSTTQSIFVSVSLLSFSSPFKHTVILVFVRFAFFSRFL